MKTKVLFAISFLVSLISLGQVTTESAYSKRLSLNESIFGVLNTGNSVRVSEPTTSEIDKLLLEDSLGQGNKPYRFAKAIFSEIDVAASANWVTEKDTAYGKLVLTSANAVSLSLNFKDFFIPPSTQMYMYNLTGSKVGPITDAENNVSTKWGIAPLRGDHLVIEIKIPNSQRRNLVLKTSSVAYGYRKIDASKVFGFGQAGNCHNNVICSQFNAWELQRNAVCLILNSNGETICSGAMINNSCNNNQPYLLSANHCLWPDGPGGWKFIFQYWSPGCSPSTDDPSYLTFNGSTQRAQGDASDFVLVELNQVPQANSGITFAGWDRSTSAATSGASIHHPSGDLMKITTFNTTVLRADNYTFPDPLSTTTVGTQHWIVTWNSGVTEGGSSGSPLFNQNQRIVGQLSGGPSYCVGTGQNPYPMDAYGRFDNSWTGNGTNAGRLSNWLSPGGSSNLTTETIRISQVTGPSLICSNGTFSLLNAPPGASVTWSTSNASGLSINSAGVATRINNFSGSVTVTATISPGNGCVSFTRTLRTWVGSPVLSEATYGVTGTLAPGATVLSVNNVNATPFYYWVRSNVVGTTSWSVSPSVGYVSAAGEYTFTLSSGQQADFTMNTSNSCGTSSRTVRFRATLSGFTVYPNPAKDFIVIERNDGSLIGEEVKDLILYSERSTAPVISASRSDSKFAQKSKVELNTRNLARGKYFLHIVPKGGSTGVEKMQIILE